MVGQNLRLATALPNHLGRFRLLGRNKISSTIFYSFIILPGLFESRLPHQEVVIEPCFGALVTSIHFLSLG